MRTFKARFFRYLLQVSLILILPACGFVDSGGSQGVPIDPRDRTVNEQTRVALNAAALVEEPENKDFRWSQVSGEDVALANAKTRTATFTAPVVLAPGQKVLVFRLNVTDEFGAPAEDTVKITVLPVNAPPTVNAGPDKAVVERSPVSLSGAVADRDGDIDAMRWIQIAGPQIALSGATSSQASFTAPSVAASVALSFRLRATDNEQASRADAVTVTVNPAPAPPPPPAPEPPPTPVPPPIPPPGGEPPVPLPPPDDDDDDDDDDGNGGDDDGPGDDDDGPPPIPIPPPPPDADDDDVGGDDDDDGPGNGGPPVGGGGDDDDDDDDDDGDDGDDDGDDESFVFLSNHANYAAVATTKSASRPSPIGALDSMNVEVLRNDRAFGSVLDPSSIAIVRPPRHGVAVVKTAGSVMYTRKSAVAGVIDSFQYTVRDSRGRTSNVATVTIRPEEPAGCWAAPQGGAVRGTLPVRDKKMAGLLMFRLVNDARRGTVSMLDPTTGKFQYTPAHTAIGGADTFIYQAESPGASRRLSGMVLRMPAIMALGGDLAAGVINAAQRLPQPAQRIGYRRPLAELLAADGYLTDLVGSQSFGSGVENFDPHNEAHAGWTATELAYGKKGDGSDGIHGWLTAHPANIILLQLGVEHLAGGAIGVEAILDEIDRWEASPDRRSVTVLISGILSQAPATPAARTFNSSIAAMVARRTAGILEPPDEILLVDHREAMRSPAYFSDRLHPSQAGYRKLADLWRDTLVEHELLEKCP